MCASSFYAHKKSPSGTAPDGGYRDGSVNAEPLKQAVFRGFGLKSTTENRLLDLAVDIILSYLFGKKEAVLAVGQLVKLSCCYNGISSFLETGPLPSEPISVIWAGTHSAGTRSYWLTSSGVRG